MQSFTPLSEEDMCLYKTTLYHLVQDAPIGVKPGATMMRTLRKELIRSLENSTFPEYSAVVGDMYKVVTDSLVSAVHRSAPHELIDRSLEEFRITSDEEELQLAEGIFDSEEDEEVETDSESDLKSNPKETADQKQRKREELKRKRREEEDMLLKEKKVTDEKGRPYRTIGPYPAPRLTVRSSTNTFPSRKALQHRTIVEAPSPSSSSTDDDEEETTLVGASSSDGSEAVNHLTDFMKPLSIDSLKKVGESAKAKLRPSSSHDEFVSQIVKTAVRLGCEKACVLMDKHKIIEEMTTHVQAGPLPTAASIDFLNSLPDQLKQLLGGVLGLPEGNPPVEDMWERMVAMGFLSVLTNLRLKPLKKIATELNISLPDTNSTEKFCEAIVFAAFPRERIRAKFSRAKKQKRIKFTVAPESMYTKGDMGFISFQVNNISTLPKDTDRHYSPEFSFAQLKWSLLCMTNKESLALYLCQTGSVHCKFLITVGNHINRDDSICNEGTQSFSAMSQENDWGFNNVIKFSDLLNSKQGFLHPENDSITIEVGIVLVEPIKPTVREKSTPNKEKKNGPKVDEAALQQLLEDEKAERTRKKIKQDIAKLFKDEDKSRKDFTQKCTKSFHDLADRLKNETKRLIRDLADRERREEQERVKDMEKIKQAQQQCEEMKTRLTQLKQENVDLTQEKKQLTLDLKEVKKAAEKLAIEWKSMQDKIQAAQNKVKAQEKKVDLAKKRHTSLLQEEPQTPSSSDEEADPMDADLTRIIVQMTSNSFE